MEKLLPKENKSYSLDRILEITFLLLSLSLSLFLFTSFILFSNFYDLFLFKVLTLWAVARAVAADIRDPRFESSQRQFLFTLNFIENKTSPLICS